MIVAPPLAFAVLAALRAAGGWGVAFAPAEAAGPRPALVLLHGMWSSPEDACPAFQAAASPHGLLVCPRGNAPLGDGRMWSGTYATVAPSVHRAVDAAAATLLPGRLDPAGGTLIGYSNGAYFAAEIAAHEPGHWTGLVLLSMALDLDPARLRAAGVRRVVLGSGDRDGARGSMSALADKLGAGGLTARFVSLGPGGHELPRDLDERMREVVAWVREP